MSDRKSSSIASASIVAARGVICLRFDHRRLLLFQRRSLDALGQSDHETGGERLDVVFHIDVDIHAGARRAHAVAKKKRNGFQLNACGGGRVVNGFVGKPDQFTRGHWNCAVEHGLRQPCDLSLDKRVFHEPAAVLPAQARHVASHLGLEAFMKRDAKPVCQLALAFVDAENDQLNDAAAALVELFKRLVSVRRLALFGVKPLDAFLVDGRLFGKPDLRGEVSNVGDRVGHAGGFSLSSLMSVSVSASE